MYRAFGFLRHLQVFILSSFLILSGCGLDAIRIAGGNRSAIQSLVTVQLTSSAPTLTYSASAINSLAFTLSQTSVNDTVALTPYLDSSCTTAIDGGCGVDQNPVATVSGTGSFTHVDYALPSALEEDLYFNLKAATGVNQAVQIPSTLPITT